jgi:hypothetical protein
MNINMTFWDEVFKPAYFREKKHFFVFIIEAKVKIYQLVFLNTIVGANYYICLPALLNSKGSKC